MINERIALIMLEGDIPHAGRDPHYTERFYKSIQSFADASLKLCEAGRLEKFEKYLKVALRLFKEGNETVRNGIVNVYMYTLSLAMDKHEETRKWIEPFLTTDILKEFNRQHYTSGM